MGKCNGIKDYDEYVRTSSLNVAIPHVRVPLLLLQNLDDPAIGYKHIDYEGCMANPYILLVT